MGGTEEESLLQPLCGGRDGGTARVLSGARRAQAFAALERVKVVGREVPPGRPQGGGGRGGAGPVVYNELIKECLSSRREGAAAAAERALEAMLEARVAPNRRTAEALARARGALAGMPRAEFALRAVGAMRDAGHTPAGPLYVEAVEASIDAGELDLARLCPLPPASLPSSPSPFLLSSFPPLLLLLLLPCARATRAQRRLSGRGSGSALHARRRRGRLLHREERP